MRATSNLIANRYSFGTEQFATCLPPIAVFTEERPMGGSRLDDLTRMAAQGRARRSVIGFLAAAFLTSGAPGNVAVAKNKNTKKKACKKAYKQCKKTAEEYCTTTYNPPFEEPCTSELKECCKYFKECKNGKANSCKVSLPW
jgi:hypothetical protein